MTVADMKSGKHWKTLIACALMVLATAFPVCVGGGYGADLARMSVTTVGGGVPVAAGYTISYVTGVTAGGYAAGATARSTGTFSSSAGDLIVVKASSDVHGADGAPTITDVAGNTYTIRDSIIDSTKILTIAYVFATAGNASNAVTATYATGRNSNINVTAMVFSKSGGTWGFQEGAQINADSFDTNIKFGSISTDVVPSVVVAGFSCFSTVTTTEETIDGTAAGGVFDDAQGSTFYRILSETLTSKTASATINAVKWDYSDLVSFEVQ